MKPSRMNLATVFPAILALGFLGTLPASAEIYRWVDEKGVTHFSDRKPAGLEKGEAKAVDLSRSGTLSVVEGGEREALPPFSVTDLPPPGEDAGVNRNASVVIYTTAW